MFLKKINENDNFTRKSKKSILLKKSKIFSLIFVSLLYDNEIFKIK